MPLQRLRRRSLLLALGLALASAAPALAGEAFVYKSQHRPAEELLPIARSVMGSQGSVVVDGGTNSLVLIGPPEVVGRARALLEAQDQAPRTVVVHYQSQNLSELDAAGVRVDWGVSKGGVRVGNARVRRGESRIAIRPQARRERGSGDVSGTLRVLDGHAGRIETGNAVPALVYGRGGLATTVVSAVSGFEVRPRVLGNGRVRIELRPYDDRLQPDGSITLAGSDSVVEVEPGETVVVGGLGRSAVSGTADVLAGAATASAASERVLTLRVEVE